GQDDQGQQAQGAGLHPRRQRARLGQEPRRSAERHPDGAGQAGRAGGGPHVREFPGLKLPARPPYFGETEAWAIVRGLKPRPFKDAYNLFLRTRWPFVIGAIGAAFLLVNLIFALIYRATGGVGGARAGSMADAFYFSVETL